MIKLVITRDRQEVDQLSQRIAHQRRRVKALAAEWHSEMDDVMRSPWVLPGCFVAGVAFGFMTGGARRLAAGVAPFYKLALASMVGMFR